MCQNSPHAQPHGSHNTAITPPAGSTHGHVILNWLAESPLSFDSLRERVAGELGTTARFHTCDHQELTLDTLLELFVARNKIIMDGDVWRTDQSKVCADA